ncbi:MAG: hypothetical protein ABIR68_09355 [Ilumatobacteraceae bacterium]
MVEELGVAGGSACRLEMPDGAAIGGFVCFGERCVGEAQVDGHRVGRIDWFAGFGEASPAGLGDRLLRPPERRVVVAELSVLR